MHTYTLNDILTRSNLKYLGDFQLILNRLSDVGILWKSEQGPWLAGGLLRRLLTDTPLDSDVDLFFSSEEQFKKALEVAKKHSKDLKENENNISFTLEYGEKAQKIKVQLINIAYFSTVEDLLNSFDFTLCQFAYNDPYLYVGEYALFDIMRKRIVINKITYPVSSLRRLIKYTHQGYYVCNGCLQQLLTFSADNRDLIVNNPVYYID